MGKLIATTQATLDGIVDPVAELIDEHEVYLNPVVWGNGNLHVLGDRARSGWSSPTSSGSTPASSC